MDERCVAHLDMDAFYVSVELRRRPELRGLPVIVAGGGPRAVVTTASYEARRFGVGSAIPASRARRLCPDGVFIAPDFAVYREASREVMGIVRAHVETVEVIGLDEAYLELTGLPAQPDDSGAAQSGEAGCRAGSTPEASMRRIRFEIERATGLRCSIGIGPNKLVAKVASDAEKPGGFVILSREQACARFADAPCGLVPGIGPRTAERLRDCGIETLGQLARAPVQTLAARFGPRHGAELHRRARFEDDSAVTEERKVSSESRETTFDYDIRDPARLESILDDLVRSLCAALADQKRCGRTVGIKVRLDDFSTHTRARTLPVAVSDADRVGPVALELLRRFAPQRPVRLLGVRVAGLEPVAGAEQEQLTLAM
jgi:DNA polymerase IV